MMDCKKKMLDLLGGSVSAGCGALLDSQPSSQSGFNGFISHCKLQQGGGGETNPFLPKYLFWQGAKGSEPSCSLVPPAAPQARGQPLMSETGKKKKISYELDPR